MNKKYLKLFIIVSFALLMNSYTDSFKSYKDYKIDSKILELWSQSKDIIKKSIEMLDSSIVELYFISTDTYNILNYGFRKKNYPLVDEILQFYIQTLPYLKNQRDYIIYDINESEKRSEKTLQEPILIWTKNNGDEETISSSQFLFTLSFAFNQISKISTNDRTIIMNQFIDSFSPVLSSHYRRWIIGVKEIEKTDILGSFSRRGWGCKDRYGEYIYTRVLTQFIKELGANEYHGATYCNVIADPSLLIISGLGHYLGGFYNDKKLYEIKNREELELFFITSIKIISQKFKIDKSINFDSQRVLTLSFQNGAWFGHPDYDYSGYIGSSFPSIKDKNSTKNVGIDVAHGSRVIYLLEMLIENQKKFNIEFPTQEQMQMFTNGFIYNVFNRDFNRPLFKNYMNGSNGWFRVNYDSREGFGYAPFKIGSEGAILGGYPRLGKYSKELENIFCIIFEKLNSTKEEDIDFINEFYEKTVWSNREEIKVYNFYDKKLNPKSSLFLLNLYSSMI